MATINPYGTLGPSPGRVSRINALRKPSAFGTGVNAPPAPAYQAPLPQASSDSFYSSLIQGNPGYIQGARDINAGYNAKLGLGTEQARRALAEYGYIPDDFADPYGYANPETRTLAQSNTAAGLSTYARLQQAHKNAMLRLRQNLAARGMLRSGGFNADAGNENRGYLQSSADATSKLLDFLGGIGSQRADLGLAQQSQLRDLASQYRDWAAQYQQPAPAPGSFAPAATPTTGGVAAGSVYGTLTPYNPTGWR